jgi:hypothetical protein
MEKRLCSRLGIALIVVGSVFLLGAAAALAASSSGLQSSPLVSPNSDLNAAALSDDDVDGTQPITGGAVIAKVISDTFSTTITITDIWNLRTGTYEVGGQAITRTFGWGQIFKLAWLADHISRTLQMPEFGVGGLAISRTQEHMGWGKILYAVTGVHGFGRLANEQDGPPKNLGQAKKCVRQENCLDSDATAVTSSTSSPGQGNAYGHNKEGNQGHGNQGHGNPHNGENPGQGQGKGHGKGKKQ